MGFVTSLEKLKGKQDLRSLCSFLDSETQAEGNCRTYKAVSETPCEHGYMVRAAEGLAWHWGRLATHLSCSPRPVTPWTVPGTPAGLSEVQGSAWSTGLNTRGVGNALRNESQCACNLTTLTFTHKTRDLRSSNLQQFLCLLLLGLC